MTEAEARKAAATFEFPPFRAEALRTWVFDDWHDVFGKGYHIWELLIAKPDGSHQCFETTQAWLDYYTAWQTSQHHTEARP